MIYKEILIPTADVEILSAALQKLGYIERHMYLDKYYEFEINLSLAFSSSRSLLRIYYKEMLQDKQVKELLLEYLV